MQLTSAASDQPDQVSYTLPLQLTRRTLDGSFRIGIENMTKPIKSSGYDTVLPVFHGEMSSSGEHNIHGEVMGTAFGIGGGYLLTAAHVVEGIYEDSTQSLFVGFADREGIVRPVPIINTENLPNDISLLQISDIPESVTAPFIQIAWETKDVEPLGSVSTSGYPYGMHTVEEKKALALRSFKGHIVSRLIAFKPLGFDGPPFRAYELSFIAPRGLSGAPLLSADRRNPVIHGLIIGNSESKMMVYRSTEAIQDEGGKTIVEQYETMTLGIAVTAGEILALSSPLLGMTIGKHLETKRLLRSNA